MVFVFRYQSCSKIKFQSSRVSSWSIGVLSHTRVLNISDVSISTINCVAHGLDTTVWKCHNIFTSCKIVITTLGSSKISGGIVILDGILISVHSGLISIGINVGLVGHLWGGLVSNWGWSIAGNYWGGFDDYWGRSDHNWGRFDNNWGSLDNFDSRPDDWGNSDNWGRGRNYYRTGGNFYHGSNCGGGNNTGASKSFEKSLKQSFSERFGSI